MLKTIPSRRISRGCRLRPLRRSRRTKHPVPMTVTVVGTWQSRDGQSHSRRPYHSPFPTKDHLRRSWRRKQDASTCLRCFAQPRTWLGWCGDATWTYHAGETRESRRHRTRRHQPSPRRGGYPTAPTWSRRTDDWLPRMFTSKILALFLVRAHKTQVASNEDKVTRVAPTCFLGAAVASTSPRASRATAQGDAREAAFAPGGVPTAVV